MPAQFIYGATAMMTEYEEMRAAQASHDGDPVAQLLIEQEAEARMALGDEMQRLREEAAKLADRAGRIVSMIDSRGLTYSPNSLGEIQGHQVDTQCAVVAKSSRRLQKVQHDLAKHLESR